MNSEKTQIPALQIVLVQKAGSTNCNSQGEKLGELTPENPNAPAPIDASSYACTTIEDTYLNEYLLD